MVRFSWCFEQLIKSRCIQLNQDLASLLSAAIPASVHLKLLLLPCSQSCSMSSSGLLLQVKPQPCCHMCEAGFQLLLHLSLCQLHRHYSVSGIIALLSLSTVCLLCFDDHVVKTCYLHRHKAQTKPSQRK